MSWDDSTTTSQRRNKQQLNKNYKNKDKREKCRDFNRIIYSSLDTTEETKVILVIKKETL